MAEKYFPPLEGRPTMIQRIKGAVIGFLSPDAVLNINNFILLTGSANPPLAQEIGGFLDHKVENPTGRFNDGEVDVNIVPELTRRSVVVVQPTSPPVNDNLMELLIMIDASRRAGARDITAVIPYFGYARKDRKDKPRVAITAKLVAQMIENAGATRMMTVDIHAEQELGFVDIPWDNLFGSAVLVPELRKRDLSNSKVASVDVGDAKRTRSFGEKLGLDFVILNKGRDPLTGETKMLGMIGDVDGYNVILIDDMIAGASSIVDAADYIKKQGADRVIGAVTHGLFVDGALDRISGSSIEEIIVTDTILHRDEVKNHPKITIVPIASLLAKAVHRNFTGQPIADLLK